MVALDWQQSAPYSQRPVEGGQDQPALCTLHCSSLVVSTAGKYAMEKKPVSHSRSDWIRYPVNTQSHLYVESEKPSRMVVVAGGLREWRK